MEDPFFLSQLVRNSEAYKVQLRIETLSINYYVFEANYKEIEKLLSYAQSMDSFTHIWIQDKLPEMLRIIAELGRLFHNFVASAKTLIDHTRALINDWYKNTKFLQIYQTEVKNRFNKNDLSGFIQDLRNYTLHYRLPLSMARMQYKRKTENDEIEFTQKFVLQKNRLMQWKRWEDRARSYLKSAPDEIEIDSLTSIYYEEVRSFNEWLKGKLREMHSSDLQWLAEMDYKIKKGLGGL